MITIDQPVALADAKVDKIRELKTNHTVFIESGSFTGIDNAWPQYNTFYTGIEACTTVQQVLDYDIDFS